jgi:hypothetical protein
VQQIYDGFSDNLRPHDVVLPGIPERIQDPAVGNPFFAPGKISVDNHQIIGYVVGDNVFRHVDDV